MRRLLPLLAAALFAGCSPSKPAERPLVVPSGTVAGTSFAPIDGAAIAPAQKQCPVGYTSVLALMLSTRSGICAGASQQCSLARSATTVSVSIVRLGVAPQAPFAAGTYPLTVGTPPPDEGGNVQLVATAVATTDGACAVAPGAPTATGSVTLDRLEGGRVSGSVDLTFSDGGRLAGAFDVPVCGTFDVCASCTGVTPACL